VSAGSPTALAAAIRRAHDGELDLRRMGELGREYLLSEATQQHAARRYRELLEEVLA
jgi:hypothetical protein